VSAMVTCTECFEDRSDEELIDDNGDMLPCAGCGSRSVATTESPPVGNHLALAPTAADEPPRVCAYGPCDESVMHPNSPRGWYSKFCSLAHSKAAKRNGAPVAKPAASPTPAKPTPPAVSPAPSTDLRRRYLDLLMDKAADAESPSADILDRIERLLEVLS
jgi:hypothetical protein